MTTVTVVVGGAETGKRLVGLAIGAHIFSQGRSVSVIQYTKDGSHLIMPTHGPDDLILVSRGEEIEDWMKPWLDQFGMPLFTIKITRNLENGK